MKLLGSLKSRAARSVVWGGRALGLEVQRRSNVEKLRTENRCLKHALRQAICFYSLDAQERHLLRGQACNEETGEAKAVAQIYISDANAPMGEFLGFCSQTVRECFMGSKYTLYDNKMIEDLLAENFEPDVLKAYQSLLPYSYRADLARFCILYLKGGWYIDVGFRWVVPVKVPNEARLLVFREIQREAKSSWACLTGAFYASPGHLALRRAIEITVENCNSSYYGLIDLCPTGPNLWGRAIAETGLEEGVQFGDLLQLTPHYANKNHALVMPDGTICAFRKPSGGGDLASIGGAGTNNYGDLWLKRKVYRCSTP